MNSIIQKALRNLENADIASFFMEMDKIVPDILKHQFSELQMRFISGNLSWDFVQQLQTFVQQVDSALSENQKVEQSITKQELLELIENYEIAEFFRKVNAIEGYDNTLYNRFIKEFISGNQNVDFLNRLKVFVDSIKFTDNIDINNGGNSGNNGGNSTNNDDNSSNGNDRFINEVKLIMVGNGRVGKTTIAKNLENPDYGVNEEESTVGIGKLSFEWVINKSEISKEFRKLDIWEKRDKLKFKFNVYDFGGQGIYRAVQHIFCSRRSLYLLVSSKDEEADNPEDKYISLAYWLPFIDSFGHQIENKKDRSPVLLLINKSDLFSNIIDSKLFEYNKVNEARKCEYRLQDSLLVTCNKPRHIKKIKKAIINMIPIVNSHIFSKHYDKSLLNVKKALEEETRNYILYEQYEEVCIEKGIKDKEQMQDWLDNVLVNIGTVIHFKRLERKQDIVILNPEWIRTAVYDVLKKKFIKNNYGRFYRDDFDDIWEDTNDHEYFISLLEAYELCYVTTDDYAQECYIVPALLSSKKPQNEDFKNLSKNIKFVLRFEYSPLIPAGTLHKLIVRHHEEIYRDWKWQDGIVLGKSIESLVWISENWEQNYIELKFSGSNLTLYEDIKETLTYLNDDLLAQDVINLDFVEKVFYKGDFVKLEVVEDVNKFAWLFGKGGTRISSEVLKQELLSILNEKQQNGIVDILEKIRASRYQHDQTKWISINQSIGTMGLALQAQELVETTKSLIYSIKSEIIGLR